MKTITRVLVALAALLTCATGARATTFYPGLDQALTDSSLASPIVNSLEIPRPSLNVWTVDPFSGARLTRVTGNTNTAIAGITGGSPLWGADSRHHYSKDQPWSADEQFYWLEQKDVDPSKIIFDSTGTVKWTNKSGMEPYCACLDSSYELRMHPTFANIVVAWVKKGNGYNKLIWWTLDSCKTKRSWEIPIGGTNSTRRDSANFGFISEGTISDDGRWVVLGTSYDRCPNPGGTSPADIAACEAARVANSLHEDTLVVVDMMYPHENPGAGTRGGRVGPYYTMPRLPAAFSQSPTVIAGGEVSNGTVGNVNISTKGRYVYAKYEGVPEYGRVFHRGDAAGADTSLLTLFPHTMAAKGLRSGPPAVWDSTLGWVACMSHADMNETTSGVEVVAGHLRTVDDGQHNSAWDENTSTGGGVNASRDSGGVVMIELATGLHRHVSAGSQVTGMNPNTYEAEGQHSSGRSVQMRGWHFVSYAYSPNKNGLTRPMRGELAAWKLDGNFSTTHPSHTVIRFGQHRSTESPYRRESHLVPSPTGRKIMFVSDWDAEENAGVAGDVAKSYMLDARTTGTKTYYLSTTPADSVNMGFHASYPTTFPRWSRFANANNGSNIVAIPAAGDHLGFPNPVWPPLGGKRYYVYGEVAHPERTTIGAGGTARLSQPGVSLAGVRVNADLALVSPAIFDTIRNFIVTDKLQVYGADRNVILNGTVQGSQLDVGSASGLTTDKRTTNNVIQGVTFPNLSAAGNQNPIKIGQGGATPRWVDSLTYADNRHTIVNTGTSASWANDHLMRSNLLRNHFSIRQTATPTDPAVFFRDSSVANVFRRDTVLAFGAGTQKIAWGYNGNSAVAMQNTTGGGTIDSCYLLSRNGSAIDFRDHNMKTWTVTRTTAVSSGGQAMRVGLSSPSQPLGPIGENQIHHNTLASDWNATGPNALADMGVVGFDGMKTATGAVRFRSNIVYSFRPGGVTTDSVSGIGFNLVQTDTTGGSESKLRSLFFSKWNAYGVYPMGASPGDKAISYVRNDGLHYAKPGPSVWNTLFAGRDTNSVYGSPGFDRGGPDSTFGLSTTGSGTAFNPAISEASIAAAADSGGGSIGAISAPASARAMLPYSHISMPFTDVGSGLADSAYIYISNTGTATLELGTPVPLGNYTEQGATATLSSSSITAGAVGSILVAYSNAPAPRPIRFTWTFTTNEPGNPTRTIEVSVNNYLRYHALGEADAGEAIPE